MNRRQWSGTWQFMGAQQLQAQSPQNHPKENSTESPVGAKVRLPYNTARPGIIPSNYTLLAVRGRCLSLGRGFLLRGFFCCPFNSYGQTEEYSQEPSA